MECKEECGFNFFLPLTNDSRPPIRCGSETLCIIVRTTRRCRFTWHAILYHDLFITTFRGYRIIEGFHALVNSKALREL